MGGRARWGIVVWVAMCAGAAVGCGTEAPPPGAPPSSVEPTQTTASDATRRGLPTPTQDQGATRGGGLNPSVRFELPTVGSDYAQKDQWIEQLVNNCDEVLHRRTTCLQLKFSFYARDGRGRRSIRDPGSDYDSDVLGNCTVTKMSPQGRRGQRVAVNSTVSIEVVCTKPDEEQSNEPRPPSN